MSILIFKDGQQYGPYDLNDIQEQVTQGAFGTSDLCWQEGWEDWRPLSYILGKPSSASIAPPSDGKTESEFSKFRRLFGESYLNSESTITRTVYFFTLVGLVVVFNLATYILYSLTLEFSTVFGARVILGLIGLVIYLRLTDGRIRNAHLPRSLVWIAIVPILNGLLTIFLFFYRRRSDKSTG